MTDRDPLEGVAVFLAIADHLSFTSAATALGLSRATVSAQLSALEARLGARLFNRSTRQVHLTEAGAAYREALTGVLARAREAERAVAALQGEASGRLKLSAPPDLGQRFLVPMIAEFTARLPAISIELDLSHRAVDLVGQGFDLAIRGTFAVEPSLVTRRIGSSPVRVVASPAYLKRHGTPRTAAELAGHRLLHFSLLRWGRAWHLKRNGVEEEIPVAPGFSVNDGEALRMAALHGMGVTLLPGFIIGDDVRAGRLVPILPEWAPPPVPLHAVYPANRHIAAKVKRFVDFLARRFRGNPDLDAEN
ncbi:LysR family transcriptional regulator [Rhodovarius crocodyli]|uniref:LysR family transcriptional regulator n=1 Tax=Rhodovarius crocodyli TaxID=1979269 RepID=A0A437MPL2_9PROT|nr:LysR family transcriptional regulator [Rhodovarius crocodyli]RVT99577.1 LysR family transcriptional regulator [Rhodovarius crocodyli]